MKENNNRILVIPDMHEPYGHPDTLGFLKKVRNKFNPTRVICLGDEVDSQALSFHDSDADLPSAGDELKLASTKLKRLYKLFPEMTILDSNHGSLALRRFKHHGIPLKFLASPNQIYNLGDKWVWVDELTITLPNGRECFFVHGISKNGKQAAQQRGMNIVQGHFHTEFRIDYVGNPANLLWSLQSGCLIDKKSMAFAYDKLNVQRPILGCSMIINSQPMLIPMILNKKSRWIGLL